MSSLLDYRAAVVADLAASLPGVAVNAHGGPFGVAELDSYAVSSPEVRVAVLRADVDRGGERIRATATLAAYCVAKRDRTYLASERGLLMASLVAAAAAERPLAESAEAGAPQDIRVQNLYSGESRERNVHLSAVTWTQVVDITSPPDDSLAPFLTFVGTYQLDADAEAEAVDTVSLPQ